MAQVPHGPIFNCAEVKIGTLKLEVWLVRGFLPFLFKYFPKPQDGSGLDSPDVFEARELSSTFSPSFWGPGVLWCQLTQWRSRHPHARATTVLVVSVSGKHSVCESSTVLKSPSLSPLVYYCSALKQYSHYSGTCRKLCLWTSPL